MPNLTSMLKTEITRLSRKEIKTAVQPLKNASISLKKTVVELKKRIAVLESENRQLQSLRKKVIQQEQPAEVPENIRVTSKTISSLRKKLGLSQGSFAKLLGVSSNAVYSMEHKSGRIRLRSATLSGLMALKGMGKKEVNRKLEEMT